MKLLTGLCACLFFLTSNCFARENGEDASARNRVPVSAAKVSATRSNVKYGEHPRQVFDIWQAATKEPSPLVIYIHGGGFQVGDKSAVSDSGTIDEFLAAGISFAAVNYRFLKDSGSALGSMRDCMRALQFIRKNAAEFNIDARRIAAYGESAGAGTSLWLNFHDNMADPASPDPVKRQSTRLTAAAALSTQATYDLLQWPGIAGLAMPENALIMWLHLPNNANARNDMVQFMGMDALSLVKGSEVRKKLDFRSFMTKDDGPFYARNNEPNSKLEITDPLFFEKVIHHPLHVQALMKKAEAIGIEGCSFYAPELNIASPAGKQESYTAFLVEKLTKQP